MLAEAYITEWAAGAPWPDPVQIEQDLILSRLIVEIAGDDLLSEALAFRGGTCLQKLHLPVPIRYSEDLDYVRTDDEPRLGAVFDALRAIAAEVGLREHRRKFPDANSDTATIWFVVLESTTYPGTTRERLAPILEESGLAAGRDFHLAFSPERIDPGRTDYTIKTTPKLLGGIDERSAERARELYSLICEEVVVLSGPEPAELAKLRRAACGSREPGAVVGDFRRQGRSSSSSGPRSVAAASS